MQPKLFLNEMEEAVFFNALNIEHGTNRRKLTELKNIFGTWKNAWARNSKGERDTDPEKEWAKLEKLGIRLILESNPAYPDLLKEISSAPLGIYYLGHLPSSDNTPSISIVGTRKATDQGKELAREFARVLSKNGIKIVSGLALGIDAESHKGTLEVNGTTLAVLGNGLDDFYPKSNERLAKEILTKGGAIISEYPLNSETFPSHFLERNRIISGLSIGTVVIEAPDRSGSLATANFAVEQNREVFVVPGFPNHPNFKGSNKLIRAGAELVTSPEDILESLNITSNQNNNRKIIFGSSEEEKIFQILEKSGKPVSIDKIIELTKLEAHAANQALSFLAIDGLVLETGDGYIINA